MNNSENSLSKTVLLYGMFQYNTLITSVVFSPVLVVLKTETPINDMACKWPVVTAHSYFEGNNCDGEV